MRLRAALVLTGLVLAGPARPEAAQYPIFDAHIHFRRLRHPDRFLVGPTPGPHRAGSRADAVRDVQAWLGQLPREVAKRIAFKNGDRLVPAP
jgi:hypothetical protein